MSILPKVKRTSKRARIMDAQVKQLLLESTSNGLGLTKKGVEKLTRSFNHVKLIETLLGILKENNSANSDQDTSYRSLSLHLLIELVTDANESWEHVPEALKKLILAWTNYAMFKETDSFQIIPKLVSLAWKIFRDPQDADSTPAPIARFFQQTFSTPITIDNARQHLNCLLFYKECMSSRYLDETEMNETYSHVKQYCVGKGSPNFNFTICQAAIATLSVFFRNLAARQVFTDIRPFCAILECWDSLSESTPDEIPLIQDILESISLALTAYDSSINHLSGRVLGKCLKLILGRGINCQSLANGASLIIKTLFSTNCTGELTKEYLLYICNCAIKLLHSAMKQEPFVFVELEACCSHSDLQTAVTMIRSIAPTLVSERLHMSFLKSAPSTKFEDANTHNLFRAIFTSSINYKNISREDKVKLHQEAVGAMQNSECELDLECASAFMWEFILNSKDKNRLIDRRVTILLISNHLQEMVNYVEANKLRFIPQIFNRNLEVLKIMLDMPEANMKEYVQLCVNLFLRRIEGSESSTVKMMGLTALCGIVKAAKQEEIRAAMGMILIVLQEQIPVILFHSNDNAEFALAFEFCDVLQRKFGIYHCMGILSEAAERMLKSSDDPILRVAICQWFGGLSEESALSLGSSVYSNILVQVFHLALDYDNFDDPSTRDSFRSCTKNQLNPHSQGGEAGTNPNSKKVADCRHLSCVANGRTSSTGISIIQDPGQGFIKFGEECAGSNAYLIEKKRCIVTLLEAVENVTDWLEPKVEIIIEVLMSAYNSKFWELRRLSLNALTQVIDFSEFLEKNSPISDITRENLFKAVIEVIDNLKLEQKPHVVVAGLRCITTALKLYGREILQRRQRQLPLMNLLRQIFDENRFKKENFSDWEEKLLFTALGCLRQSIMSSQLQPLTLPHSKVSQYAEKPFLHNIEFTITDPLHDYLKSIIQWDTVSSMNLKKMSTLDLRITLGIIAETVEELKDGAIILWGSVIQKIIPITVCHQEACVRKDAVYLVGELFAYGGESMRKFVSGFLEILNRLAEGPEIYNEVLDEIVVAHSKLLCHNFRFVREDKFLDVLLLTAKHLPIKMNLMANQIVFDCFYNLLQHERPMVNLIVGKLYSNANEILANPKGLDHGGKCSKAEKLLNSAKRLVDDINSYSSEYVNGNGIEEDQESLYDVDDDIIDYSQLTKYLFPSGP